MVDAFGDPHQFIPFKNRNGLWDDIEPVKQYENGPAPIAPVAYQPRYQEVLGYFRAIINKEEISERAFNLTTETIMQSQGNYTAWFYRRKLLDELKKPLEEELEFLNDIAIEFEKNFQIWHHRRCIIEKLSQNKNTSFKVESEKGFLQVVFLSDAKNYHAWAYRTWLVERFQLWENELTFIEFQLDSQVTNNSIWSYRHFYRNKCPEVAEKAGSRDEVIVEAQYVLQKRLDQDSNNEAAWVYLRGLYTPSKEEADASQNKKIKRVYLGDLVETIEPFLTKENWKNNRFCQMCLVDLHKTKGDMQKAVEQMEQLRDHTDKIRKNYWQWCINAIKQEKSA